ncbi:MAG TPA: hypothetical protein VNX68_02950 [Nitrosopumilaceae archaeon]|nr:hypothetical protein [Nitrosopumilaceae archaeon]
MAILFAFTPKVMLTESWLLYTGQTVQGTESQIKATYCPGSDLEECAMEVGGSTVIYRP